MASETRKDPEIRLALTVTIPEEGQSRLWVIDLGKLMARWEQGCQPLPAIEGIRLAIGKPSVIRDQLREQGARCTEMATPKSAEVDSALVAVQRWEFEPRGPGGG